MNDMCWDWKILNNTVTFRDLINRPILVGVGVHQAGFSFDGSVQLGDFIMRTLRRRTRRLHSD